MIKGGDGARFALEAVATRGIGGEFRRQRLERDLASELRILGQVHFAHAATAEEAADAVVAKRTG